MAGNVISRFRAEQIKRGGRPVKKLRLLEIAIMIISVMIAPKVINYAKELRGYEAFGSEYLTPLLGLLSVFIIETVIDIKNELKKGGSVMLEKQTELLNRCNMRRLEQQFENEDIAKEVLLLAKDRPKEEQQERQKFLDRRLEQRKDLYIYPAKVAV